MLNIIAYIRRYWKFPTNAIRYLGLRLEWEVEGRLSPGK